MMFNIMNELNQTPCQAQDPNKDLGFGERLMLAMCSAAVYLAFIVLALLLCWMLGSCSAPKEIEQHEHHYYQADSMAIQAAVDARMTSWHQQMDSTWRQAISQYTSQWSSQSDEKEVTTETVTEATDSLGRVIRTEQRRTERSMSQQQQQQINSIRQEMESRITEALSVQDSIWQSRYDELQKRVEQSDSTSNTITPVAVHEDNRPWYKRWLSALGYILIGAVVAAGVWFLLKIKMKR